MTDISVPPTPPPSTPPPPLRWAERHPHLTVVAAAAIAGWLTWLLFWIGSDIAELYAFKPAYAHLLFVGVFLGVVFYMNFRAFALVLIAGWQIERRGRFSPPPGRWRWRGDRYKWEPKQPKAKKEPSSA